VTRPQMQTGDQARQTTPPFRARRCLAPGVIAVEARSDRAFPRHSHDQFGIGLITGGAQTSLSGRGTVQSDRGDLITVNPNEVHDGIPFGGPERSWLMLYIDPRIVSDSLLDLSEGRIAQAEFNWPSLRSPSARALFQDLYRAATAEMTDLAQLAYESNLPVLLSALCPGFRTDPSHLPGPVMRAKALMDDDPAAALTLTDLAQASGLSRYHLVRSFSARTGLSPHAYLVQRRIALARRQIAAGATLATAAAQAGFADQSHMTRAFTRCFGLTPAAYARAARQI